MNSSFYPDSRWNPVLSRGILQSTVSMWMILTWNNEKPWIHHVSFVLHRSAFSSTDATKSIGSGRWLCQDVTVYNGTVWTSQAVDQWLLTLSQRCNISSSEGHVSKIPLSIELYFALLVFICFSWPGQEIKQIMTWYGKITDFYGMKEIILIPGKLS